MYGDDKKEAFIKEYLRYKVIIETSLYAIFKNYSFMSFVFVL